MLYEPSKLLYLSGLLATWGKWLKEMLYHAVAYFKFLATLY